MFAGSINSKILKKASTASSSSIHVQTLPMMVEEDPVEEGADAEDSNSDQDQESNAGASLKQVCVGRQDHRGQRIIVTERSYIVPRPSHA